METNDKLDQMFKAIRAKNDLTTMKWRSIKPRLDQKYFLMDSQGNREEVKIIAGLNDERIIVPASFLGKSQLLSKAESFDFLKRALQTIGIYTLFRK